MRKRGSYILASATPFALANGSFISKNVSLLAFLNMTLVGEVLIAVIHRCPASVVYQTEYAQVFIFFGVVIPVGIALRQFL